MIKGNQEIILPLINLFQKEADATVDSLMREPVEDHWDVRIAELKGKHTAYTKVIEFLKGKL